MQKLHPIGNAKLFENDVVRVWRVDLNSREELPFHQHEVPYLVMHETDGHLGVTESDGSTRERRVVAGAFDWHPVGELHALLNLGDVPYRNLLIEFRVEGEKTPQD
jgi:quercetin dioxygenase-like cupin family protein